MKESFTLDRLPNNSAENILDELRRVAKLVGSTVLSKSAFSRLGRVSPATICKRFGSWYGALIAAGLGNMYSGQRVSRRMRSQPVKGMSNGAVLESIRMAAGRVQPRTLTAHDVGILCPFTSAALRLRFGSVAAAFDAAGLKQSNHASRYTDEECFENLAQVWAHYGRAPQYQEINSPPSAVGGKAYVRRFGTWNRAIVAFVEAHRCVNETARHTVAAKREPEDHDTRNPRIPPAGLRYTVLRRDGFRCVLCGRSPATDASCCLHVDHVVPACRGGKTDPSNLRSLCDKCNLGKGSRLECDVGENGIEPNVPYQVDDKGRPVKVEKNP